MRAFRMDTNRTVGALATALAVVALTATAPAARADDVTGTPSPTTATTAPAAPTPVGTTTDPATGATDPSASTTSTAVPTGPAPTATEPVAPTTVAPSAPATTPKAATPKAATPRAAAPAAAAAAVPPSPVVISRTATVAKIKDLQIRLKLAGTFGYGITGVYWSAVDRAVLAFQVAQKLPQSGVVDQRTWDRLRAITGTPTVIPRSASGVRVKDLQVRLRLTGHFTYGFTGVYWSAVDRAVLAFQLDQNLPQTGIVDQRTWTRLRTLTSTPTVFTRFTPAPQIRELQLRLKAVGRWPYAISGLYWSAVGRSALSFQQAGNLPQSGVVDQRTWARLLAVTHRPGTFDRHRFDAGERPLVPALSSLDARCRTGRVMCVDKATRTLTWVVDGKPLTSMWARFGRPGKETREGTFRVSRKYEYVISNLYFTPMPYSMFFSGGQAVHYSSNFARLGYASASHGCVNIADMAQVKALFFQVRIGDKVVVHH